MKVHEEFGPKYSAVSYSHAGRESLASRLKAVKDASQIPNAVRAVNAGLDYLSPWHEKREPVPMVVARDAYAFRGTYDYLGVFDQRARSFEQNSEFALPEYRSLKFARLLWKRTEPTHTLKCLCHGDSHPSNWLFDGEEVCLIDFAFTGEHHFLRDFCLLEVDTCLKVLCPPDSVAQHHDFAHFLELKEQIYGNDFELRQATTSGLNARLTLEVLRAIRARAWKAMEGDRNRISEYRIGLLRYAISRAGHENSGLGRCQRLMATHFALQLELELELALS